MPDKDSQKHAKESQSRPSVPKGSPKSTLGPRKTPGDEQNLQTSPRER